MQNKRSGPGKPGETKGRGPNQSGGKGGYGAKGGAGQKPYGKPGYKKDFGGAADKPGYKKDFGGAADKPGYRKSADNAEQRPYGDKPGYKKNFNGPRGGSGGPDGYRAQGSADGRPYGDKPGYKKNFNGPRGGSGGPDGYRAQGSADGRPYGDKPGYKKNFNGPRGGSGGPDGYRAQGSADGRPYGDKPGYKKNFNGPRGGSGGPDGYRAQGSADGRPYGDKPGYRKSFDNGEQKPYGDKPGYRKSFDNVEKKPYGDKPGYRKSFDNGEQKPYGDKPGYRKSFDNGEKKPYGDKPGYRKSFDNGEQKPYGDKPAYQRAPREGGGSYYGRRIAQDGEENLPGRQDETDELPYLIIGRNAVREAVKSGRSIDRILVMEGPDGSLRETVDLARDRRLLIREVDKKKLDELCMPFGHGGKTANHQGIVAYAAGVSYCTVADILAAAKDKGEEPFVIVLDEIQDPHNLGSIIRSADCAGAHGVVIGKRRSASVTSAAVKASAGAVEHMPVARVTNITETLKELKQAGLWIAGADMDGTPMSMQSMTGPLVLVVGAEGDGLSRLVRESCDFLVSIPMTGHIGSLNASVAAAILMFEKRRQDNART